LEELRRDAEKLAEERRVAREQALEWTREVRMDSDDEKERKPKKPRKQKADGPGSGDEAEPKKKRRGKLKRGGGEQEDGGEEPAAVFSDDEEVERPKKVCRSCSLLVSRSLLSLQRVTKKRVIRDDEDEEVVGGPRKKQLCVSPSCFRPYSPLTNSYIARAKRCFRTPTTRCRDMAILYNAFYVFVFCIIC
jgi:RNA polymerase-associated protein CTR9